MLRTDGPHLDDGTLRRLVDEPAGVADTDRAHAAGCPTCLSGLAAAQADAALAGATLAVDPQVDVDVGWRRLSDELAREAHPSGTPLERAGRRRRGLRSPVVAAVGAAALLAGAGAAAAADWLQIFRTERVAPVAVTETELVDLPDLSAYGDVELGQEPDVRQVTDADAAERVTGLDVPDVAVLPQGVTGEPTYQVGDQVSLAFTFSAEEAAEVAAAEGEPLPAPPPRLDGSRFRLVAGPGVAAVWSSGSGAPGLVVARAVAPTAFSSGVPFEQARDYLLSLPGLPEDVAAQLRGFTGDGTTLPLPVPAGQLTSTEAEVDGTPATVLTSRDGLLAGVVWVEDGIVTAVAGSLSPDEVLTVARGLDR